MKLRVPWGSPFSLTPATATRLSAAARSRIRPKPAASGSSREKEMSGRPIMPPPSDEPPPGSVPLAGSSAGCDLLHTSAHRGGLASRCRERLAGQRIGPSAGDVDMAGSPRALSLASVGAGHDVRIKTERWHTYPRPSICRVFAERNVSAQKPGCLARDENGLDGSMQTGTSMSGTSGTARSKGTISEGAIPASLITSPDEKQRKPCRGDEWSHRHAHHAPPHWLR